MDLSGGGPTNQKFLVSAGGKSKNEIRNKYQQELVDQWSHTRNKLERDPVQGEQEDDVEGQMLHRKLGMFPLQNQWVTRWLVD